MHFHCHFTWACANFHCCTALPCFYSCLPLLSSWCSACPCLVQWFCAGSVHFIRVLPAPHTSPRTRTRHAAACPLRCCAAPPRLPALSPGSLPAIRVRGLFSASFDCTNLSCLPACLTFCISQHCLPVHTAWEGGEREGLPRSLPADTPHCAAIAWEDRRCGADSRPLAALPPPGWPSGCAPRVRRYAYCAPALAHRAVHRRLRRTHRTHHAAAAARAHGFHRSAPPAAAW